MEASSKSFHKLFRLSFPKLLYQTNLNIQTATGHKYFSRLLKVHSFTSPHEFSTRSITLNRCNCKYNHICSANSMACFSKRIHCPTVNPDIMFLKNVNPSPLLLQKVLLNGVRSHNFVTTTNNRFRNKLIPFDNQAQVSSKLFAHKAEMEQPVIEGVGWAGQPIVKRVHSILPEVYGDVSDIFQPVKELGNPVEGYKGRQLSVLTETSKDNPAQVGNSEALSADCSRNEASGDICDKSPKNLTITGTLSVPEEIKNRVRSHDTISFINDSGKEKLTEKVLTTEIASEGSASVSKHRENGTKQQNILIRGTKKAGIKDSYGNGFSKSRIVLKKSKKKMRKKTKVCSSSTGSALKLKKRGTKKKIEAKVFRINKKNNKFQTQLVLNQRTYTQPFQKNMLFMENRQLKTDSGSRYPAKKRTEICGEAESITKKINEWKPEMCLVKKVIKTRRRTFVCASKVARDKRKRNLPKCPKPEKKVPPKVLICPPRLEDELSAKDKTCQIQEEVKVRKRTQVCKPVIIFGKEKTAIKSEKVICEKKVKKIKSRHTLICPPPNEKNKNKKSKKQ